MNSFSKLKDLSLMIWSMDCWWWFLRFLSFLASSYVWSGSNMTENHFIVISNCNEKWTYKIKIISTLFGVKCFAFLIKVLRQSGNESCTKISFLSSDYSPDNAHDLNFKFLHFSSQECVYFLMKNIQTI